jgi:hypothetical protein
MRVIDTLIRVSFFGGYSTTTMTHTLDCMTSLCEIDVMMGDDRPEPKDIGMHSHSEQLVILELARRNGRLNGHLVGECVRCKKIVPFKRCKREQKCTIEKDRLCSTCAPTSEHGWHAHWGHNLYECHMTAFNCMVLPEQWKTPGDVEYKRCPTRESCAPCERGGTFGIPLGMARAGYDENF